MSGGMEGGCACGQVRYRVLAMPMFVNQCHCTLCRRQTGAPFVVNLFVETAHVGLLSGEISESRMPTGSGGEQTIIRCAGCGTALWSHYSGLGRGCAAVRAGTLDDPAWVRPDAEIYTASRLPWVAPSVDVPGFEGYYKPSDLLPAERFARLRTVLKADVRS